MSTGAAVIAMRRLFAAAIPAVALLTGCAGEYHPAQIVDRQIRLNPWAAPSYPPPFYQPPPQPYFDSVPDDAPVTQAEPRRGQRHKNYSPPSGNDDGPVISNNPPAPAPVPKTPADPDCPPGSWWDICHIL
jgi:hypothetical protein